jgi:hypothetical protein
MPSSPLHEALHFSIGKPHPAHAHEGRERRLHRSVPQVEFPLRLRGLTADFAPDHHPDFWTWQTIKRQHSAQHEKIGDQRTLVPLKPPKPLPGGRGPLARSSTVTLAGLEGCRRSRRGAGPLGERVCGGTQQLGRRRSVSPSVSSNGQTFVSRGTSDRYHNPAPAKRSRKAGESPYPSSHQPVRFEPAVSHDLLDRLSS